MYLFWSLLLVLGTVTNARNSSCRNIPGDVGWPTDSEWAQLNETVDGRLIATIPLASVCHTLPYHALSERACAALQAEWDYVEVQ